MTIEVFFHKILTLLMLLIVWLPFLSAGQWLYEKIFAPAKCIHGIVGGVSKRKCKICCKPCKHGVFGGVTLGNCSKCMEICPHGFIGGVTRKICPFCLQEKPQDEAIITPSSLANNDTSLENSYQDFNPEQLYNPISKQEKFDALKDIDAMNGYEFEDYICQLYQELGYEVEHTPYSGDGGKDAVLKKDGEIYLVECKHYVSGAEIGERDLRIFDSAMHDYNAKKGFYINLGRFRKGTDAFAKNHNIELIGRKELQILIEQADKMYGEEVIGV